MMVKENTESVEDRKRRRREYKKKEMENTRTGFFIVSLFLERNCSTVLNSGRKKERNQQQKKRIRKMPLFRIEDHCSPYDRWRCPSSCAAVGGKCMLPALTVRSEGGGKRFALDTGSSRSLLRDCSSFGLKGEGSGKGRESHFLGGAQKISVADKEARVLSSIVRPYCEPEGMPDADMDGLIGIAPSTNGKEGSHSFMNSFPAGERKFVMQKRGEGGGYVCVGKDCLTGIGEEKEDAFFPSPCSRSGCDLSLPFMYPSVVRQGKLLFLDTGSTATQKIGKNFTFPLQGCVVGYNDMDYLSLDYDHGKVTYTLSDEGKKRVSSSCGVTF